MKDLVRVKAKHFFKLPVDVLWAALKSGSAATVDGFIVADGRVCSDGSGHFFVRDPRSGRMAGSCREDMEEIFLIPKTYLYRYKDHFGELEYPIIPIES